MSARVLLPLCFAALSGTATAQALDIKGWTLGMPRTALEASHPEWNCTKETSCFFFAVPEELYFGPAKPHYSATIRDGKVVAFLATFKETDFRAVVEALTEKYGKPTADATTDVQNRMGARFANRTVEWVRGGQRLSAMQRLGQVDESAVGLAYDNDPGATAARKAKAQENAKKL